MNGNAAVIPGNPGTAAMAVWLDATPTTVAGLFFETDNSGIVYVDAVGGTPFVMEDGVAQPVIDVPTLRTVQMYSASIQGTGGFRKTGGGSFELITSMAGLSGNVTVEEGTLYSDVNVNALNISGGEIRITGGALATASGFNVNVGGTALRMSSGFLNLGNTLGVGEANLATNGDFLMSGGTWNLTINSAFLYDAINGAGAGAIFSITGGTLTLGGTGLDYGATYNLLAGFSSGTVSGLTISGYDTGNYTAQLDNTGTLSFVAVPEPSVAALFLGVALGSLILLLQRRTRVSPRNPAQLPS